MCKTNKTRNVQYVWVISKPDKLLQNFNATMLFIPTALNNGSNQVRTVLLAVLISSSDQKEFEYKKNFVFDF